jgi:Flp pilus assembly protein, ATPase CpaF
MDLKSRLLNSVPQAAAARTGADDQGRDGTASAIQAGPLSRPGGYRALSEPEREWQYRLHQELMTMIDLSVLTRMEEKDARVQVRELAGRLLNKHVAPLSASSREAVIRSIEDEIFGLGPIEPLLGDPAVSDILVNDCTNIYVERHGKLELTPQRFRDEAHLMNIIERILSAVGRRVDESSPMADARLKDGSRVNVIIPPLAIDGPCISIRRFPAEHLKVADLIQFGTLSPAMADLLKCVVRGRLNILISGGTGSGKTTLLNVLSGFIPHDERIVTIEDAAELQLQQPHVVRLETRPANLEGKGEVKQRDLVRNALRMRPERIILGEIRGEEAFDMLQAMNTGHDGSLATIHANSPRDSLARLENMVAMTGLELPTRMVRAQIASAVNIVMQISRLEDGTRHVLSLQEIQGMEGDVFTMSEIFRFERRGLDDQNRVVGSLKATGVIPEFYERLQRRGIAPPISVFGADSQGI